MNVEIDDVPSIPKDFHFSLRLPIIIWLLLLTVGIFKFLSLFDLLTVRRPFLNTHFIESQIKNQICLFLHSFLTISDHAWPIARIQVYNFSNRDFRIFRLFSVSGEAITSKNFFSPFCWQLENEKVLFLQKFLDMLRKD